MNNKEKTEQSEEVVSVRSHGELDDTQLEQVAAGSRPNCSTPLSTGADASTDFRKH